MRPERSERFAIAIRSLCAAAVLATSASATDYFVDAILGDNANTGTSPGSAWRTITYALSQLPVPSTGIVDVVHVAPGIYDAALGESYPLVLMGHDAVQIVGDAGPETTILDAGGASSVIFDWPNSFFNWGTGPDTRVEGLTLTDATDGIVLGAYRFRSTYLTCRNLILTQMSAHAISLDGGVTMAPQFQLWATFERVTVRDSHAGVAITTAGAGSGTMSHANVSMVDCTIERCVERGVVVSDTDFDSHGSFLSLRRSRITDNGSDGVRIDQGSAAYHTTSTEIFDCLIARNGAAGVNVAVAPGVHQSLLTAVRRCTIAHNAGVGLDTFNSPFEATIPVIHTALSSSIVYGNGDDVRDNPAWPTIQNPSYDDIGDGDYVGIDGNIAVNPVFRDAANGDYRLVWSSPCVDVGDPAPFPLDALDLQGANRDIDGNLDVARRSDMGALEFAPLWPVDAGHIGGTLALELWGPAGGTGDLLVMRGYPLVTPVSTSFGDLFLIRQNIRTLGRTPIAPGPPALRWLMIPNDPSLIGRAVTFQALATSSVGASTLAYTNAATVRIVP